MAAIPRPRRRLAVALQAVALAVLAALVLRFVDREQLRRAFAGVSWPSFAAFVVLMFATRMVAAWRWLVVARDHVGLPRLGFGFLLRVELLADFANIWVQSLIGGEAVRVWKVIARTGEKTRGPGSVVLDRILGTVTLAVACLPLLAVLAARAPALELPAGLASKAAAVGIAAAVAVLAALLAARYVEALRSLARRAFASAVEGRFMAVPFLIALTAYPLMAAAHYLGVPELAERSWVVAAMVAILPRLGQAIPLSIFGVTAVEGGVFAVGRLLEVSPETILVVVALNLTTRYLGAFGGAAAEIALHGTRFFRDLRGGAANRTSPGESPPPEPRRSRAAE